jgi:ParB family transcriptional regulator, chromosome partitioning protein
MQQRKSLGRGLSALLPGATSSLGPREISLDLIDVDADQPRQAFDPERLAHLAESLRRHGVIQPVIVRREGERFVLLAGERRVRAARLADLTHVPAVLREDAGLAAFEIAVVENLQREDLDPLDEARAYQRLMEEGGRTQTEVATLVGRSRAHVANTLRLLSLPDEAVEAVRAGQITAGHARALLSLPEKADEGAYLSRMLEEKWSVRRAEREAKKAGARRRRAPNRADALKPYFEAVSQDLSRLLAVQVSVRARGGQGSIEIPFSDLATLRRLVVQLSGNSDETNEAGEAYRGQDEAEAAA